MDDNALPNVPMMYTAEQKELRQPQNQGSVRARRTKQQSTLRSRVVEANQHRGTDDCGYQAEHDGQHPFVLHANVSAILVHIVNVATFRSEYHPQRRVVADAMAPAGVERIRVCLELGGWSTHAIGTQIGQRTYSRSCE